MYGLKNTQFFRNICLSGLPSLKVQSDCETEGSGKFTPLQEPTDGEERSAILIEIREGAWNSQLKCIFPSSCN